MPTLYIIFLMLPIYWLVNMELQDEPGNHRASRSGPVADAPNYAVIFTDPAWYNGYLNSIIYVVLNTVISVVVALPAAYASRVTASSATSTCSSGC